MKISKRTIARTIVFFLALINAVFTWIGWNPIPISTEQVYEICSAVAMFGASVWAWWKNNSFTKPALQADTIKDYLEIGLNLLDCVNMAVEETRKDK